ncbi:IS1182 family transposase [Companilactobacillus allii]|nr:IS1182 family transposase [Companilactobacillus allii]
MAIEFIPEKDHEAYYINELVESIEFHDSYETGRPREYDLRAVLKLVLFSYLRGRYTCRQIEREARENIYARWLTQEHVPSYRTIARFIVSDEAMEMIQSSFESMRSFLVEHNLIDDCVFIDGTKILANANKYSFVWKKKIIHYDDLNREKAEVILNEIKEVETTAFSESLPMDYDNLDLTIAKLEERIEQLDLKVEETKKISPNSAKRVRRIMKSKLNKTKHISEKHDKYSEDMKIFGERNSFSKTDHDATFMRVKEDPMQNGQLKPGYNLQIATSNQFTLDYDLFWNPTDTRTLIPFLKTLETHRVLGRFIVADAGYGSESNYRYIEDELLDQTSLIPYGTMLKENSRKWKSDEKKVLNWDYHDIDDYYIDPNGVRFNFLRVTIRTDKYKFKRQFRCYKAESKDENQEIIDAAFNKSGGVRYIYINSEWEYFKAHEREKLYGKVGAKIYAQRKIDVEPVFGHLKAYLHFTRFTVRGTDKVKSQMGLALMAMNMGKLAKRMAFSLKNKRTRTGNLRISKFWSYFLWSFVTSSYLRLYSKTERAFSHSVYSSILKYLYFVQLSPYRN